MLYIIGLGLNELGISLEGKEAVKKCKKVYLDGYTVEFPYSLKKLVKSVGKKFIVLNREYIESDRLVLESKKDKVCLLVYGSPLFATTHISLIDDCRKARVKVEVIHAGCIFDIIAETGLQLYKFGKIASMPKWQSHFEPDSFLDLVNENKKIGAHTLILIDIGLSFKEAMEQLIKAGEKKSIKLDKIVICSRLGTNQGKIFYGSINNLKKIKNIKTPFSFIIPGKMHFLEKEILEKF